MTRQISLSFEGKGVCESVKLKRGYFLLEAWGAQGGTCGYPESGKGGYSKGIFHNLKNDQTITICVGLQGKEGNSGTILGGFNGGGNGYPATEQSHCCGGGGGSTNIILGDKNGENLVIAGGGGGIASFSSIYFGGHAGGYTGESNQTSQTYGQGGSQSEGGKNGYYSGGNKYPSCTAGKGNKGSGGNACTTAGASAGGGGGGYYGGGGGADIGSGGGGSGYINPKLRYRKTYPGSTLFVSPTSGKTETGHKGDGYAIISATNYCTARGSNQNKFLISFVLLLSSK